MRRWLGGRWQGGRGERGGRGGGTRVKGRWRLEEGGGERRGLEWRGCEAVSKTFLGSTWRTHVVRAFLRGAGRGARKASSRAEMASVSLRFVRAAEAGGAGERSMVRDWAVAWTDSAIAATEWRKGRETREESRGLAASSPTRRRKLSHER